MERAYQTLSGLFSRREIWGQWCLESERRSESGKAENNVADHLTPFFVHGNNEVLANRLCIDTFNSSLPDILH